MFGASVQSLFGSDDIDTPTGRAIVEARYSTLRRQVPIVYVLALVNLAGLQLAIGGTIRVGFNLLTALAIIALIRIAQWRRGGDVSHAQMVRRMNLTAGLSAVICFAVLVRCLIVQPTIGSDQSLAVMLFGGFTAIGVAYGLSCHPVASRAPLLVLAFPLAATALISHDWQYIGAALSLAFVALLILRLLNIHTAQFTDLIRSRSMIVHEQQLAESARQEAVVAATTDFLTGLPNRRAFVAALEAQLKERDAAAPFAVGVMDLDRFKFVNDTFGHGNGDALLQTVARRLVRAAGEGALVARLGGDEFGLLFPGMAATAEARTAGTRILEQVNRPMSINGRQLGVSACAGFAIFRKGKARTPSHMLAEADVALYQAKARPAEGVAVFEPHMEAPQRRRMQIERGLLVPNIQEQIYVVFQPIVELGTGKLVANEALARWRSEELGEIAPSEFVPIAEQLNLISGISQHLMLQAIAEATHWPAPVRLSFNLSAIQLCTPGSAAAILGALEQSGLDTERVQVEVTETALLADFKRARENLAELRSAGATIVLDDFGAGYASIGYLKELHFDQIKLDGGLVTAAQDNADGERLLAAVIGLCQALGVSTVAEHVENEHQLKLLMKLGCALGQGFWLHPPLPAAKVRDLSEASTMIADTVRTASDRDVA
jgi:diguanylate cyclase (GGDEF)-like protein